MKKISWLFIISIVCFTINITHAVGERVYTKAEIYWENGIIYDKELKKPLSGVYKAFYESGNLKTERPYKDGKIHGVEKSYYESGALMGEIIHNEGVVDGSVKNYYESGSLKSEIPYLTDGVWKEYYESGKLKSELSHKNGEFHGVEKVYYESGNLKAESPYKDGKQNGVVHTHREQQRFKHRRHDHEDHTQGNDKRHQ